jgi:fructose-1,6-bisphosphatase/inositol monophosphatase family enzyme
MFCVSIAFILGGLPVVGVIYQPMLDGEFSEAPEGEERSGEMVEYTERY